MSQVYTVVSHPAILLMSLSRVALTLTLCVFASRSHADELVSKKGTSQTGASQTVACATSLDPYFVNQVWAKLGSQKCLTCHQPGGDAEESEFLLSDPHKASGAAAVEVMRANRDAFVKLAKIMESDQSLLLLKASGNWITVEASLLPRIPPAIESWQNSFDAKLQTVPMQPL